MKIITQMLCLLAFALITACNSSDEPTGVIPEHQIKALEKANDVENLLQESEQKRRKQIDET